MTNGVGKPGFGVMLNAAWFSCVGKYVPVNTPSALPPSAAGFVQATSIDGPPMSFEPPAGGKPWA